MTAPPQTQAGPHRTVLITGASGTLGKALTLHCLNQNWRVAATFHRSPIPLQHPRLHVLPIDIASSNSIRNLEAALRDQHLCPEVLIHAAGSVTDQTLPRVHLEDWNRTMDEHLKAAFLLAQAVIPGMRELGGGHLIFVSSFSARTGNPGQAAYAAAKAGLIAFTQSLARECAAANIRANVILPGLLPSPMISTLAPPQQSQLVQSNLLQRLNDPDEVARFIVFLTEMRNVSGQCFQLDSRIAPWT